MKYDKGYDTLSVHFVLFSTKFNTICWFARKFPRCVLIKHYNCCHYPVINIQVPLQRDNISFSSDLAIFKAILPQIIDNAVAKILDEKFLK